MASINKHYRDDIYEELTDEFQQIQTCVGMYIGSRGSKGALHLFKEIFNNALDECTNEGSPADHIVIILDEKKNLLTCGDNGRGVPFDKIVEICRQKHTSTKFGRKFNARSTGCNGVGLTVTAALSEHLSLTSYRTADSSGDEQYDGYEKTIAFNNCELTEGKAKKQDGGKKNQIHGLYVEYIPSEKYLGKFQLTADTVLEWLRHMSYVIPPSVTIDFINEGENGYARPIKAQGLEANVRYLSENPEFEPFIVGAASDSIELEMSFTYDKTHDDEMVDSYCNYAYTPDNGFHVSACRKALCEYFTAIARKLDPDSKYEVTYNDCRKGLVFAVNCFYYNVDLGGQDKSSVESEEIDTDMKPLMKEALANYFDVNRPLLNKIVAYLRQMAKIRLEAAKIKGIKPPKPLSMHDEADIDGYYPLKNRNHKGYCELYIAEGDSAGGAIKQGRNPEFQAVYCSRGVIKNAENMTLAQMMKNDVLQEIIRILGCGIGPQFDITNLRWSKIILLPDGDADGGFIKSLECNFFSRATPGIITEGRLYVGIPPLYIMDDKMMKKYKLKKDFIFSKHEYQQITNSIIADNVVVSLIGVDDEAKTLSKRELINWLIANDRYPIALKDLTDRTSCHPVILERVCFAMTNWPKYATDKTQSKEFKNYIERYFPEITYNENDLSIYGAFEKERYLLIIDKLFAKMAAEFLDAVEQQESVDIAYRKRTGDITETELKTTTIGEFFNEVKGLYAFNLNQRFKGLGEIEPELLFYTTLNPKIRRLVRLTTDDMEATLRTFDNLHGKQNVDYRKKLLLNAKVSDDDIDN